MNPANNIMIATGRIYQIDLNLAARLGDSTLPIPECLLLIVTFEVSDSVSVIDDV